MMNMLPNFKIKSLKYKIIFFNSLTTGMKRKRG